MDEKNEDRKDGYESVCAMCHRPESVCGTLLKMPPNICLCKDCLQKSFDLMAMTMRPGGPAAKDKPEGTDEKEPAEGREEEQGSGNPFLNLRFIFPGQMQNQTKLKPKKKYYVRIRTYKKIGKKTYYSDWSKPKTVKTK